MIDRIESAKALIKTFAEQGRLISCMNMESALKRLESQLASMEVKEALAQAADEIDPATPEEDFEARRAQEASQPFRARLTVPASEWERLKGLNEQPYSFAIKSGPAKFGDLPVITFNATLTKAEVPAEPTKRVPQINDVIVSDGKEWVVVFIGVTGAKFWAVRLSPSENFIRRVSR